MYIYTYMNILDLPNEIHEMIISNLNPIDDRMSYMMTCKKFNTLGDDFFECSKRLEYAVRKDDIDLVKKLLKHPKCHPEKTMALYIGFSFKYNDIVTLLLQDGRSDPRIHDNELFCIACWKGQEALVKLLLKDNRIDPSKPENKPIIFACYYGYEEIVKILLKYPQVDPYKSTIEKVGWTQDIVNAYSYSPSHIKKLINELRPFNI